jgi:hypothetical protein
MTHVVAHDVVNGVNARFQLSVMAIFRNEAHVLAEWIEHYRLFGVEHFYLIDNKSSDNYLRVLNPYLNSGIAELFTCRKNGYQIGAYTEMLPKLRRETEWVGVFDLDEFIYPRDGEPIAELLSGFDGQEAVLMPWLSFGSNGHLVQPPSVVSGFTRRGDAGFSRAFLKAFSRPRAIEVFSQHNPITRLGRKVLTNGQDISDVEFIRIEEAQVDDFAMINNHYRLQSLSYFRDVKTSRPEVHEEAQDRAKTLRFFNEYDGAWSRIEDRRLATLQKRLRGSRDDIPKTADDR